MKGFFSVTMECLRDQLIRQKRFVKKKITHSYLKYHNFPFVQKNLKKISKGI